MSLYIGKPGGSPLLHITKGNTATLAQMKGTKFSDTVFHSDIDYLDFKIYKLQNGIDSLYNHITNTSTGAVIVQGREVTSFAMTEEQKVAIFDQNRVFFLYNSADQSTSENLNYFKAYNVGPGTLMFPAWGNAVFSANPYDILRGYFTPNGGFNDFTNHCSMTPNGRSYPYITVPRSVKDTTYLIVIGMTNLGAFLPINNYVFTGEVNISRTVFTVGSTDIKNLKYVSPNTLNTADWKVINKTGNDFQLIGSDETPRSTVQIVSNNTETKISFDNVVKIHSAVGSTNLDVSAAYSGSTPYWNRVIYDYEGNVIGEQNFLISSQTFSIGQVLIVTATADLSGDTSGGIYPIWGTGHTTGQLIKYKDGYISSMLYVGHWGYTETQLYGINGQLYQRFYYNITVPSNNLYNIVCKAKNWYVLKLT